MLLLLPPFNVAASKLGVSSMVAMDGAADRRDALVAFRDKASDDARNDGAREETFSLRGVFLSECLVGVTSPPDREVLWSYGLVPGVRNE